MKNLFAGISIVTILTGCATSPVPLSEAKPLPRDRVYVNSLPPPNSGGSLVVTRDSGFLGGGCFVGFYIDGALAAKYETGETGVFQVSAGEHIVGVGNPGGNGVCALNSSYRRETSTVVKIGDVKYFRMVVRPGDGISLEPTTMSAN